MGINTNSAYLTVGELKELIKDWNDNNIVVCSGRMGDTFYAWHDVSPNMLACRTQYKE